MKNYIVTDEEKSVFITAENVSGANLRASNAQLSDLSCQYKEEDFENKIMS